MTDTDLAAIEADRERIRAAYLPVGEMYGTTVL
jgi:hypothetical protein